MRNNTPTARQLEFQRWEIGIFVHFGIRTFYEGHKDFGKEEMTPVHLNFYAPVCSEFF